MGVIKPIVLADSATIEAHFDAENVPQDLADRLMELGFEPDGFARFEPAHFTEHYTFKVKLGARNLKRRRELRQLIEQQCITLMHQLAQHWPQIDGYLELEAYDGRHCKSWITSPSPVLTNSWALPYAPGAFAVVIPACDATEADNRNLPLKLAKRADIHLKIARELSHEQRETLIAKLEAIGFYRVLTWAGNHICTAQFARGGDAKACFDRLSKAFDRVGGCTELIMETVVRVWRTGEESSTPRRLGSLPQLVTSIHPVL